MEIIRPIFLIVLGYLCGSVIFARVFGKLLHKEDAVDQSEDKNPGTANAFTYGGFWYGTLTLTGDMAKGFFPMLFFSLYLREDAGMLLTALMIVSPVIGHILPVFFGFRGGKGIAVGFGSMLGLAPWGAPAFTMAAVFIFFSLIVKISPNYYRTIVTYLCGLACIWAGVRVWDWDVLLGYFFIMSAILIRLLVSREEKGKVKVSFLWMH